MCVHLCAYVYACGMCVCVCACAWVCAYVRTCMYVCVHVWVWQAKDAEYSLCLSFPSYFHSKVVFLHFYPCLGSLPFIGTVPHVINFYKKFSPWLITVPVMAAKSD